VANGEKRGLGERRLGEGRRKETKRIQDYLT
jgi:hypothetical protein